jgi:hypothetical protein
MTGRFYIVGVDLGQACDPSAIAVVEVIQPGGRLRLRHLERTPLGTPYPDVVERVRRITAAAETEGRCYVIVDATGGRPVVDLLRGAKLQAELLPVVATRGRAESVVRGYYTTPKRTLILMLESMLRRGVLQIASGLRDRPALVRELEQMQVRTSRTGRERFAAWGAREHDDLVFAVALACWGATKITPRTIAVSPAKNSIS